VAVTNAEVVEKLYTTKDLANILDIPQYQIMLAIDNGLIPCYVAADRWRFVSSTDSALLSELKSAASIATAGGLTLSQGLRMLRNGIRPFRGMECQEDATPAGGPTQMASRG
jgi:hypothetical protein